MVEELGRGANAVVYRARHQHGEVAIKLFDADAEVLPRFRVEVGLLARIQGRNIPRIYEAGIEGGRPYIVKELAPGMSLARRLEVGPLPLSIVSRMACEIAGALDVMHRRGFVHRDLKPANVIVADDGAAKIVDFDLGGRIGVRDELKVGTIHYGAPEQLGVLTRSVDERADLYSLGAVLFEALSGWPPFQGSAADVLAAHAASPVPSLTRFRSDVSEPLVAMVERLLAKDPNDRFQSARDFLMAWGRMRRLGPDASELQPTSIRRGARVTREPTAFTGRFDELRRLQARWDAARGGSGSVVVIRGPDGSGRTRLGDELGVKLAADGAAFLDVRASPEMKPLEGIRHAISAWIDAQRERIDPCAWRERLGDYAPLLAETIPRLSELLGPQVGEPEPYDEAAFLDGIARLLVLAAQHGGGALVRFDDVQWLDDPSCRVLKRLCVGIERRPMLLVVTAWQDTRDPPEGLPAISVTEPGVAERIELGRLMDAEVEQMISSLLGGDRIEPEATTQFVRRCYGLPLAVELLLGAVLERGLAMPRWGTWRIDLTVLDRLEPSAGLSKLVLLEFDCLEPQTLRVLQAASVWGVVIERPLLRRAFGHDVVEAALADAVACGVLVPGPEETLEFVHRRARDVVAASLGDEDRRCVHHAFAEVLETSEAPDLFAIAHHRTLGSLPEHPEAVIRSNVDAGRLAYSTFAYAEAYRYLEAARQVATHFGRDLDPASRAMLGEACQFIGDMSGAVEHLEASLAETEDSVARARIRGRLAEVYIAHVELEKAWTEVLEGYREIRRPLPSTSIGFFSSSVLRWAAGSVMHRTGWRVGRAEGRQQRFLEVVIFLSELAQWVSYLGEGMSELMPLSMGQIYDAQRIGPSSEMARAFATYAVGTAALGWRRSTERYLAEGLRIARMIGDRQMEGRCRFYEGMARNMLGDAVEACQVHRRNLEQLERWLDPSDYIRGCADLGWILGLRGYAEEAVHWLQSGRERAATIGIRSDVYADHHCVSYLVANLPVLGQPVEAKRDLEWFRSAAEKSGDPWRVHLLRGYELAYFYEIGEYGDSLQRALEAYDALAVDPKRCQLHRKNFFVYKAYARIEQALKNIEVIGAVSGAVRDLERAANVPVLRAHAQAARGAMDALAGRHKRAERRFVEAENLAREADAPWVLFQVAWYRAQFAIRNGQEAVARREANLALSLARAYHWTGRQRRVETEFRSVLELGLRTQESSRIVIASAVGAARQLEALLEVEEASARVLEPEALSRVVLDEVVRILGAQRAFLFVSQRDSEALACLMGRDSQGEDVAEPQDFSRTVIEEVWDSGRPLVLQSTADGEALGSDSVVAHDLRSVLAAPLKVHGRKFGVVYVDTRLAEGMFTGSDAAILSAIARHIPMAIENARAARLEVQVESERQRRVLADQLRRLTAAVGSTLKISEVLERLLGGIDSVVGFDRAIAWVGNDPSSVSRVARGYAEPDAQHLDPELWSELCKAARPIESEGDGRQFVLWFGRQALPRWKVVPLGDRGGVTGAVVLETSRNIWNKESMELVRTFSSHASAAIENASLFQTVQRLATVDELTGTSNRRHFFALAEQELARSERYRYPLAALMIDVDHFKAVNDTYGHAAGDIVLQRIGEICIESVREVDVVGRYGGEEFVIVLPHANVDAAKAVAERLRRKIRSAVMSTESGPIRVTASIGLASRDVAPTLGRLLQCADEALYRSKRAGRDRVTVWAEQDADG